MEMNIEESVDREIWMVQPFSRFSETWKKLIQPKDDDVPKSYNRLKKWIKFNFNNDTIVKTMTGYGVPGINQAKKLRWDRFENKQSQRGDMRIICTYISDRKKVFLLDCYTKNEQKDINNFQARIIVQHIKYLKGELNNEK